MLHHTDVVAPLVLLGVYTLCVDPFSQYGLGGADVGALLAVYAACVSLKPMW